MFGYVDGNVNNVITTDTELYPSTVNFSGPSKFLGMLQAIAAIEWLQPSMLHIISNLICFVYLHPQP